MKTADSVEFYLGMTLYLPIRENSELEIFEYKTNPETNEIEKFQYEDREYTILKRKGESSGNLLNRYYSSRNSIIDSYIQNIRNKIKELENEIISLENLKTDLDKPKQIK